MAGVSVLKQNELLFFNSSSGDGFTKFLSDDHTSDGPLAGDCRGGFQFFENKFILKSSANTVSSSGSVILKNVATPTEPNEATSKSYVDNLVNQKVQGLDVKDSCSFKTTKLPSADTQTAGLGSIFHARSITQTRGGVERSINDPPLTGTGATNGRKAFGPLSGEVDKMKFENLGFDWNDATFDAAFPMNDEGETTTDNFRVLVFSEPNIDGEGDADTQHNHGIYKVTVVRNAGWAVDRDDNEGSVTLDSRAIDLDGDKAHSGAFTFVENSTTDSEIGSGFVSDSCTLLGSTAVSEDGVLKFTQFSSAGTFNPENVSITGGSISGVSITGDTLEVAGATTLATLSASSLGVTGTTTLFNIAATGDGTIGGTFGVTGDGTIGGTLGVTGATTLGVLTAGVTTASTLEVAGATTLDNIAATGNGTIAGTLAVTGATTLGVLSATGNGTIAGTLGVAGATTLDTIAATGNGTIGGTFEVAGATTLDTIAATGNGTIGGTFEVIGATTLTSITASGSLSGQEATFTTVSSGVVISTSDRRLKQNIVYSQPADTLREVMKMRPAQYQFKTDPCEDRCGVIAQDLQETSPNLVKSVNEGSKNQHLAVNYIDMIASLVGSVQALKGEIDELRGVINGLL